MTAKIGIVVGLGIVWCDYNHLDRQPVDCWLIGCCGKLLFMLWIIWHNFIFVIVLSATARQRSLSLNFRSN